ncbi:MAG: hypothetical protein JWO43_442 [Candidatus Adlerbacteria bacterium]|nr:hypothetical protein [Candidatus Adlerbacteria bacterium]
MNVSGDRINLWASPISETEEQKCQNAMSAVIEAMRARFGTDVTVIKQGSHRNRTNIRADSDVDIAVVYNESYFPDTSSLSAVDKALHEANTTAATYRFEQFKNDVHAELLKVFGAETVERKDKCIRVKGNSYRVNADVVPAFGHKRYRSFGNVEAEGIGFVTDRGVTTFSYPDQHYANGVSKNDATDRGYKPVVRILKHTRNEMIDKAIIEPDSMASFLIESLVWNIPHAHFRNQTRREDARAVALQIWSDMKDSDKAKNYAEVSDLKYLFHGDHTPTKAQAFMLQAWDYLAI